MYRRQLLLTLAAGCVTAAPLLREAFEVAMEPPARSVDDWLERAETYEREYISATDVAHLQDRLAGDLARLRGSLDHPVLGTVAARLLTLYGLVLQGASASTEEVRRWLLLGARAADRSGDTTTRVWVRGRAAMSLAYHGLDSELAASLAGGALAITDRSSPGRVGAELALLHLDAARRSFDALSEGDLASFAFSEWRVSHVVSRLAARMGNEPLALRALETVQRGLPTDVGWPHATLELQRALLMVRCGDRAGGLDHAIGVLDNLPSSEHRPEIWHLVREIEADG